MTRLFSYETYGFNIKKIAIKVTYKLWQIGAGVLGKDHGHLAAKTNRLSHHTSQSLVHLVSNGSAWGKRMAKL
jgi:hypothetical protein